MGGFIMTMNEVIIDLKESENTVHVYEKSYVEVEGCMLQMIKIDNQKYIVVTGQGKLFDDIQGDLQEGYKRCPLTHENRLVLNTYLEYTNPIALGNKGATIGLGDRLGLASPGHIRTIEDKKVHPVLAQQSIRELSLTNRSYKDVMDAACFAVFQEGYKEGFGADGDHLKEEEDIQMSIDLGFTMLTLDCTDKIDDTIDEASEADIESKYMALPQEEREEVEGKYLNKEFKLTNSTMTYDRLKVMKYVLIYGNAIEFMKHVYDKYIQPAKRGVDFEISIDETSTPTTPESHYFIANELYSNGVKVNSMAPRFIGEFQKGIDYMGDIDQFEKTFRIHAEIADTFGYKLSIHSGSDKFHVFPIVAKYTKGRFHVKTAGTNWLEAVRIIAKENPELYRKMHKYALDHFGEAKKYYHVTTNIDAIEDIDHLSNEELPSYMNDDNARQLLHITYGLLLQAKDAEGKSLFKDAFFETLDKNEDKYAQGLIKHIGKHIELLGIK